MATHANVRTVNINDLKEYSPEARVNLLLLNSEDFITRMGCYEPGQITPLHFHPDDDEVLFCVEGRGAVTLAEHEEVPLRPGSLVSVPAGVVHGLEAASDSRMVVIYTTNAGYTTARPHAESSDRRIRLPGERSR